MLLWIIFAFMTAAALLAVLVPLGRRHVVLQEDASGVAVYRDQLRALDADVDRGMLERSEADDARLEISRRLLAEAEARKAQAPAVQAAPRPALAAILLSALVVVVAVAGYLAYGSPRLEGLPAAQRLADSPDRQQMSELVAKVEAHLLDNPGDGRGWDVVAPAYLRMGEFAKAARAFNQAIRLLGPSADRYGGLGEAVMLQESGLVTAQAREAFESALELDADLVRPRYFLAVAREQDQQWEAAAALWRTLLEDTPAEAPYRPVLERKHAEAQARASAGALAGPDSRAFEEAVGQAGALDLGERREMIEQMVSGLAARLEQDGGDLEGWLRLIRSYAVLERPDEAGRAAARARAALAGDPRALAAIDRLVAELDAAQ